MALLSGAPRFGRKLAAWGLRLGLILGLALGQAGLGSRPAQALDRDVRTVLIAGVYGALGGTALGLVTFPINQDLRTVFMGTSVGLYLGLVLGVFYIRDQQHRQAWDGRPTGEAPEQRLRLLASTRPASDLEVFSGALRPNPLKLEFAVARF